MPLADSNIDPETRARLEKTWKKAYGARTREDLLDLYAAWSESYDEDHEAIGFVGHKTTSRVFARHLGDSRAARVLDAGAGTGAGGGELARRGFRDLTALDLSAEMLEKAREKGVFGRLVQADLDGPLDMLASDEFDGVILVGVFSYGQAPAHALDEILRVTRPGGLIAFTMRVDFFESNAMGVRRKIEDLEEAGSWRLLEVSQPEPYLPKKDPSVMFRVWCYEVLEGKRPVPTPELVSAARQALLSPGRVRRIDHALIWDPMASRLYDAYTRCEDYYVTDSEAEILNAHADQIAERHRVFVELGCGSARKIKYVLDAALELSAGREISYLPIDLSEGALAATRATLAEVYGDRVRIEPHLGHFRETLSRIPAEDGKNIFFFGSSIGNVETPEATVRFLADLREVMTPLDQLAVGFDLQKDPEVLLRAYNAGAANLAFFVHMVRKMNHELGADFDLSAFRLASTYDKEPSWNGLETCCMNLKVATEKAQDVHVPALGFDVHLDAGDAIQVGTSRKFRTDDIRILAALSGLRVRTLWLDHQDYFALAELVRDDAPLD
jgi:uncharacterized SAM-dependent methyltransferase/ubiquinone/menaquinone biosynthesis C-methylase UbiE